MKSAIINFGDCVIEVKFTFDESEFANSSYTITVRDILVEEDGYVDRMTGVVEGNIESWTTEPVVVPDGE